MSNIEILKRLYKDYTKKYLSKIFLSVFFSLIVALSTSLIAYLLDPAIEKIFIEKNKTLMVLIPFAILFAFALKGSCLYLAKVTLIKVGGEIQKTLQLQIMDSFLSSSIEEMDKKHSGKIISHLTYDAGIVKTLVTNTILLFTKDTLTLIGLISVMFYQNWKLAIFALIMIPLASMAAKSLGKRIGKVTTQTQEAMGLVNAFNLDIIKNHKIIKIFQKEDYEFSRANNVLDGLKEKMTKISVVLNRASPIMETLTGIMIAGLIYYAGQLIFTEELEVNNFFSFLAAMMLAYQPVRSLATLNMGLNQGIQSAKRVLPIIDLKNKIIEKENSIDLNLIKAEIKFENVNFKYNKEEKKVLDCINLNIVGGEMTSLVGHSGAGKSTILNLIPRFYDPNKGDIKIDEQSIYNSTIYSLRKNISLVSQDTTLFDDTIKNNIAYADAKASQDEIEEAAKLSFADEFIKKLPNKYETLIGENGVRLSGGEKQRISIARAMMKKSSIILLDEATSALDNETESKIQEALKILTRNKTTIVIAHRLSTILNSDNIYVIDAGKVVESGKHNDLLNKSELYKKFYEKQIQK